MSRQVTEEVFCPLRIVQAFTLVAALPQLHSIIDKLRQYRQQKTEQVVDVLSSYEQPPSFHNILLSFSNRQCKDPRDKIFSVLGLAPARMFDAYTPNYQQPLMDCFTDVFRRMLEYDTDASRVLLGRGFGPYNKWISQVNYYY